MVSFSQKPCSNNLTGNIFYLKGFRSTDPWTDPCNLQVSTSKEKKKTEAGQVRRIKRFDYLPTKTNLSWDHLKFMDDSTLRQEKQPWTGKLRARTENTTGITTSIISQIKPTHSGEKDTYDQNLGSIVKGQDFSFDLFIEAGNANYLSPRWNFFPILSISGRHVTCTGTLRLGCTTLCHGHWFEESLCFHRHWKNYVLPVTRITYFKAVITKRLS